jgi:hypothetical protein
VNGRFPTSKGDLALLASARQKWPYHLVMHRFRAIILVSSCLASCVVPSQPEDVWHDLLTEQAIAHWQPSEFGISGREEISPHAIRLSMGNPFTGVTWDGQGLSTERYELEVVARKVMGNDFFCGVTFPVGPAFCTLVSGGWGGSITGLSSIDGKDASENATRTFQRYDIGADYTFRIRVEDHQVQAWVNNKLIVQQPRAGTEFSVRFEVEPSIPLGIACYNTEAFISACRIRSL